MIALLGGYINIIYMLFGFPTMLVHGFNFDMSLIKRMYTVDGRDEKREKRKKFEDPVDSLKHRVQNRKPFLMTFSSYFVAVILTQTCFCCCKEKKWFKKRAKLL